MIRSVDPKKKSDRKRHFKWRGHDILRIEGFSDAVFAFAMTLLVVSLEVPKTFNELKHGMSGFIGFGICFLMLMLIWYEQYVFFRQFRLHDLRTIVLNGLLLFTVLMYVYPLKFLFSVLIEGNTLIEHGEKIHRVSSSEELTQLMVIYGCGYVLVYFVFVLMYQNVWKQRDEIKLNQQEQFFTKTEIYKHLIMMSIGLLQVIFALILSPNDVGLSGMTYILIWPALTIFFSYRFKIFRKKFSQEEIEAHYRWIEE